MFDSKSHRNYFPLIEVSWLIQDPSDESISSIIFHVFTGVYDYFEPQRSRPRYFKFRLRYFFTCGLLHPTTKKPKEKVQFWSYGLEYQKATYEARDSFQKHQCHSGGRISQNRFQSESVPFISAIPKEDSSSKSFLPPLERY